MSLSAAVLVAASSGCPVLAPWNAASVEYSDSNRGNPTPKSGADLLTLTLTARSRENWHCPPSILTERETDEETTWIEFCFAGGTWVHGHSVRRTKSDWP